MAMPGLRFQRTLKRAVSLSGVGFFSGTDVRVEFRPAPIDTGRVFHRDDLPGSPPIPATIEFCEPALRRTRLVNGSASVELTEHVLAALAGLRIDNCHIHLTGPELPGVDGSARPFVECLSRSGSRMQSATVRMLTLDRSLHLTEPDGEAEIIAGPSPWDCYQITYELDYGDDSPIGPEEFTAAITPEIFASEVADARTFVLESEVESLRELGIGRRHSASDLLVIGECGPLEGGYRHRDECARHKVLDCLGDFALLGCDLIGDISASRSGHRLNQQFVRELRLLHPETAPRPARIAG